MNEQMMWFWGMWFSGYFFYISFIYDLFSILGFHFLFLIHNFVRVLYLFIIVLSSSLFFLISLLSWKSTEQIIIHHSYSLILDYHFILHFSFIFRFNSPMMQVYILRTRSQLLVMMIMILIIFLSVIFQVINIFCNQDYWIYGVLVDIFQLIYLLLTSTFNLIFVIIDILFFLRFFLALFCSMKIFTHSLYHYSLRLWAYLLIFRHKFPIPKNYLLLDEVAFLVCFYAFLNVYKF